MPASARRLPVRQAGPSAGRPGPPPAAPLPPPAPPTARPPTEEELVRLWHGQHLPADALATRRGELLRVVYRGRLSPGPGPDFRDAIIQGAEGQLWQGDLEVHVRASGFRLHGHDRDPAYDSIVLHLVWEDDEGEDTLLACGRRVAVVALASWFQRRRQELERLLTRPDAWREPCFTALARLGAEAVGRTLDRLGDLRFRQKTESFRRVLSAAWDLPAAAAAGTADQILYAAVLEALGYGGHREAFARLGRELPYHRLRAAAADRPVFEAVPHLETMLLAAASLAASGGTTLWRPRCWLAGQRPSPPTGGGGPPAGPGAVGGGSLRPVSPVARRLRGRRRPRLDGGRRGHRGAGPRGARTGGGDPGQRRTPLPGRRRQRGRWCHRGAGRGALPPSADAGEIRGHRPPRAGPIPWRPPAPDGERPPPAGPSLPAAPLLPPGRVCPDGRLSGRWRLSPIG